MSTSSKGLDNPLEQGIPHERLELYLYADAEYNDVCGLLCLWFANTFRYLHAAPASVAFGSGHDRHTRFIANFAFISN